jgi:hypothetical protein
VLSGDYKTKKLYSVLSNVSLQAHDVISETESPYLQELLVATRHVLATDFRKGFFTHIDILLDER